MPQPQAQPTVAFATPVPAEVDALRRRLQRLTGDTVPDLVTKALKALEYSLGGAGGTGIENSIHINAKGRRPAERRPGRASTRTRPGEDHAPNTPSRGEPQERRGR